ncbi:unnamed protein product [Schistocephalus solidus]|uniref:Reverse transcriptase domain-containing protein n=1 Tax=Schistocephalus solidus TaxID=70667 RepID=A0A183TRV7_SCHSO|nr:unnamed protein product [Schistocephalus solidus]
MPDEKSWVQQPAADGPTTKSRPTTLKLATGSNDSSSNLLAIKADFLTPTISQFLQKHAPSNTPGQFISPISADNKLISDVPLFRQFLVTFTSLMSPLDCYLKPFRKVANLAYTVRLVKVVIPNEILVSLVDGQPPEVMLGFRAPVRKFPTAVISVTVTPVDS